MIGRSAHGVNTRDVLSYKPLFQRGSFSMQESEDWPDFESLEHRLLLGNTPFSPGYIHGMMMGILCISQDLPHKCWQRLQGEIPYLDAKIGAGSELFEKLFLLSLSDLEDFEGGVRLMLPQDDSLLAYRIEALADWCDGFLAGIELADKQSKVLLQHPLVKEIVADFNQVKEVSLFARDSQANEKAYAEIIEFIRISIQLIYAEKIEKTAISNIQKAEHQLSSQIH
jgi:uncharacterized protein